MPLLARGSCGRRLVVFAAVLSVVLSYAGAPPVHAQTDDEERTTWTGDPNDGTVEVTDASASGSTCIGDADKSPLRLEIVPGGRVSYCFRLSHEALTDGWWVMIKADGSVGLSWVPSVGRRVDQADSRHWKRVSIVAEDDAVVGTEVTFKHDPWEDDTFCPIHSVGIVMVRVVAPPPGPELRIDDITVNEGAGRAEFTVRLNAAQTQPVYASYATSDDSAMADSDYRSANGTVIIGAGETSAPISVTVIDDSDEEQDETFKVRLTNPVGATIEDDEGVGTIRDDDGTSPPPTMPSLRIGDATVDEGGGPAVFTVTANAESSGTMTVDYVTAADSATAGDDYTSTSGTLTFLAGQRTATIEVTVLDDSDEEQDETFKVRLTNPDDATIEDDEGVGTIRDDDGTSPPPTRPSHRRRHGGRGGRTGRVHRHRERRELGHDDRRLRRGRFGHRRRRLHEHERDADRPATATIAVRRQRRGAGPFKVPSPIGDATIEDDEGVGTR